jgi:FixJ family two-component response regulator
LTARERQVLERVATGKLNKQIAAELGAAQKTIKVHRGRVMQKMQVSRYCRSGIGRIARLIFSDSLIGNAPVVE